MGNGGADFHADSMQGTGAAVDHDHLAEITPEMIDAAAAIAAVKLTAEQKAMVLEGLKQQRDSVLVIRSMKIPNSVAPAFVFDPVPAGMKLETERRPMRMSKAPEVKALVREERTRWRLLRCASWRSW